MRKKLIIGNLKMNPLTPAEMDRYLDMLEKEMGKRHFEKTEIVICPPAVYFDRVVSRKIKQLVLGAQDVFWERQGAFTGEISAAMAKAIGAKYSIVGHSERRRYFGETNNLINTKLKAILKAGMQAVLCIGESARERSSGETPQIIRNQLQECLTDITAGKLEFIDFVYEPIWAVGSDKVPTSDEILEAKLIIKKTLAEQYGLKLADKIKILYGGSIAMRFVQDVCIDPAMDGGLVGRESLVPQEFIKIADFMDKS